MEFLAPALEQPFVCSMLDHTELELIGRFRLKAARVNQFRVGELPQCRTNSPSCMRNRLQQLIGERAPEYRSDLHELSLVRADRVARSGNRAGWLEVCAQRSADPPEPTIRVSSSTNNGTPLCVFDDGIDHDVAQRRMSPAERTSPDLAYA